MILHRTSFATLTSTEAPLLYLIGPSADGVTIFLENLDNTNFITYRLQFATANTSSAYIDSIDGGGTFGSSGILSPISGTVSSCRTMISIRTNTNYARILAASSGSSSMIAYGVTSLSSSVSNSFSNGTW